MGRKAVWKGRPGKVTPMTLESREPRVAEKEATLVSPLGGALVDLLMTPDELADLGARTEELISLRISETASADLALLGSGAYSPLSGFQGRSDYLSVVEHAQLSDGTPWTLPITLPAGDHARSLQEGAVVALRDEEGHLLGALTVTEIYDRDLEAEAREVYRTTDQAHPGVAALFAQGPTVVAGPVRVAAQAPGTVPSTPVETRATLADRGSVPRESGSARTRQRKPARAQKPQAQRLELRRRVQPSTGAVPQLRRGPRFRRLSCRSTSA